MVFSQAQQLTFELISSIHLKGKKAVQEILKPFKLTYAQFTVLLALLQKTGVNQKHLSEILEIDTTNTMVICDGLEKKHLLLREKDPSDRRSNLLSITNRGKEKAILAYSKVAEYYTPVVNTLSNEETETLNRLLIKLNHSVIKNTSAPVSKTPKV